MKKRKIIFLSILGIPTIASVIGLTTYFNSIKNKTIESNNFKKFASDSNQINEETDTYKTINGVRLAFPTISGPNVLNLVQGSGKFHPSNYNYFIYDQLDNSTNKKVKGTWESIDTNKLGEQEFTMSYTNKYQMSVSKTFKVKIVSQEEWNNQNVYEFTMSPKIVNGEFMRWNSALSDWQNILPVALKQGEKILVEQLNPNINNKDISMTIMTTTGVVEENDPTKLNPKTVVVGTEFEVPFESVLYVNVPYMPFSNEKLNFKVTIKNVQQERKQIAIYHHDWSKPEEFQSKWKAFNSGAIAYNNSGVWVLTNNDLQKELGTKPDSLISTMEGHERLVKDYSELSGLVDEINGPEDLPNLKINARHLMYSIYSPKLTIASVSSKTMITNIGKNSQYGIGVLSNYNNGSLKHEVGHYFQGSYKNKGYNLIDTSNIFNWLYFDWKENIRKSIEEYKKENNVNKIDDATMKTFEEKAWNEMKYVAPFDSFANGAKQLKDLTQNTNDIFAGLDNYDALKQYIFLNIFRKVGWQSWNFFNKEWRKIDSISINNELKAKNKNLLTIDTEISSKWPLNPNSNFADSFYYLIGKSSGYDVSQFLSRVGIYVKPEFINIGIKEGWKPLMVLNDVDPNNEKTIKEKNNLPSFGSLIDNSQLDRTNTGSIKVKIENADLKDLKGKKIKLIDNANGSYNIFWEQEIHSLEFEIPNLSIGSYFLEMPFLEKKSLNFDSKPFLIKNNVTTNLKVEYKPLSSASLTSQYINIDGERAEEKDLFKIKLEDNKLIFSAFWTNDIKIKNNTSQNGKDFPEKTKFLQYSIFDASGVELINPVSYKSKATSKKTYKVITSETGEIVNERLDKIVELDFSKQEKYKLELISQISSGIRFKNNYYDTYISPANIWSPQTYDNSKDGNVIDSYDSTTWSTDFKNTKKFLFTITKNGIELGWDTHPGANTIRDNQPVQLGYTDAEKNKIKENKKQILISYVKEQIKLLQQFEPRILEGKNNLIAQKQNILNILNTLKTEYTNILTNEETQFIDDNKNFIDQNMQEISWKISPNSPSKLEIEINKNGSLNEVLSKTKYIDDTGQEISANILNIEHTNVPFGENGKFIKAGTYFIKFDFPIANTNKSIKWEMNVEVK